MKRIAILFLVIFGGCTGAQKTVSADQDANRPNVLIIYPDQLRRYSAGFWSKKEYAGYVQGKPDPVYTPTMDRLALNGAVVTNAVSNFPLCSPARGMLLTGQYPEQNGIWNNCKKNRDDSLDDNVETFTDIFYELGYNTSYFGKCHWLKNEPHFDVDGNYVGSENEPGGNYLNNYDTYVPPGKGRHHIEYFYQSVKDHHFDPLVFSNDSKAIDGKSDGQLHKPKIFSPKNEAQKITAYLKNDGNVRDTDKPFFMIWSINPPHNPWDDWNTDMEVLKQYYGEDKYPSIDSLLVRTNVDKEVGEYVRNYYANITSMDFYIGQVMNALEQIGQLDNTLIILSSDHGEMLGSHGRTGKNIFETEAIAVPLIVHLPNKVKKGTINEVLFSMTDILPTTLGILGLQNQISGAVQGIDFSSTITTGTSETAQPEGVLLMLQKGRGIHTKTHTLCLEVNTSRKTKNINSSERAYYYDNVTDPYQLNRIPVTGNTVLEKKLLSLLSKELKRTNDPWYLKKRFPDLLPYGE